MGGKERRRLEVGTFEGERLRASGGNRGKTVEKGKQEGRERERVAEEEFGGGWGTEEDGERALLELRVYWRRSFGENAIEGKGRSGKFGERKNKSV